MPLKLTSYYRGNEIPPLPGKNIFHSPELFRVYEATPGYTPVLVVGSREDKPVFRILAVCRKSIRLFPPALIKRCEIYGTGELLDEGEDKDVLFKEVISHLTGELLPRCFFIEFRNLENSLFGYKHFRDCGYFPVNWLKVRNSLHSLKTPMERFSESRRRQIRKGLENGAVACEAANLEDISGFSRMLRKNYSAKIRKHLPAADFFRILFTLCGDQGIGKIFLVRYKEKIIGGSVCLYSEGNAYLFFSGGMRKSYAKQYPGVLSVWKALEDAYERGIDHLEFMDAGLPFKKHGYRDFILRFGGKQSSTRRWFRFRWNFLNKLLVKIYV